MRGLSPRRTPFEKARADWIPMRVSVLLLASALALVGRAESLPSTGAGQAAASAPAASRPAARPRVFITPIADNANAGAGTVDAFTQSIAGELSRLDRYEVVSVADLRAIVSADQVRQSLGCDRPECVHDLGEAVGTDFIVTGQVGKIGSDTILTLTMLDNRTQKAAARVNRVLPGEQLQVAVARAADELAARVAGEPLAELGVTSDPTGAKVLVDGVECGATPLPPFSLRPGPHRILVQKHDYKLAQLDVTLAAGERQVPVVKLEKTAPQLGLEDVAKIAAASARQGAQEAATSTAAMVDRKLDAANAVQAERARVIEAKADAAQQAAEAARKSADEKAETARVLAERAAKDAEEARVRASTAGTKAQAAADQALEQSLEAKRIAMAESERARAEAEKARLEAERARLEAELARREAEEKAQAARREQAEIQKRTEAKLEENRRETEEIRQQVKRVSGETERLRTGAFGFHVLNPLPRAEIGSEINGLGGANPPLSFGLDGRVPLFWRTSFVMSLDWWRDGISEVLFPPDHKLVLRHTVPIGVLHATAGLGATFPILGPLYVEGSLDAGARLTLFDERRVSEAGEVADALSTRAGLAWGGQLTTGLAFGTFYVAIHYRRMMPMFDEPMPEKPSLGPRPSFAGFGTLDSWGGLFGFSW